ncbi:hypothetical protein BMS3Abin17_01354 [archaeon BMS3Abin17]|nr:hypothetical protein BMS3Abin17_01354 [archaeon BMS3Abin17]HDZ60915.1 hypothetical protein [Candidatus Pacearchaeota archaeon]
MIKDERLSGHASYTFPNMLGNAYGVYRLEYIMSLSQSSLKVSFGDGENVLFQKDGKNMDEIKISNPSLANDKFEGMDNVYRRNLARFVDSKGDRLLLKGIAKSLDFENRR